MTAIWLARLGNLAIVLNNRTAHEHNSVVAPLERYWDLRRLSQVLPVFTRGSGTFRPLPPGRTKSDACELNLLDRAEIAVSRLVEESPRERARVEAEVSQQRWRSSLPRYRYIEEELQGSREDRVLSNTFIWFHEYFLMEPGSMEGLREVEKYFFRYRHEIFSLGWAAVEWLGRYSSVHNRGGGIRLNDRRQPPFEDIIPSYLLPGESTTALLTLAGEYLYVATNVHTADADTLATLARLRAHLPVVTMENVSHLWVEAELHADDPDYLACVEQVILAHGRLFWPTARSSYSDFVVTMRQFMDVPLAALEKELWKQLVLKE